MELYSVLGNRQLLDGGAMFGNCPKAVWEKWAPADAQNRIDLACRCLLVRESGQAGRHPAGRHVLLEAGIGAFFEPKLRERYGVCEAEHVLLSSLEAVGVAPQDIDIIVLSHLHFDHAGGLLAAWQQGAELALAFPNASYVIGKEAWERALAPHPRDKASFIPGLCELLQATGRLHLVEGETCELLGPSYRFHLSHGHTPGLLLTEIATPAGSVTFMGDLVPGVSWVHAPITMGYDRYPELLINEKVEMLQSLADNHSWAFFTHDPHVAAAKILRDEKGRFHAISSCERVAWLQP